MKHASFTRKYNRLTLLNLHSKLHRFVKYRWSLVKEDPQEHFRLSLIKSHRQPKLIFRKKK